MMIESSSTGERILCGVACSMDAGGGASGMVSGDVAVVEGSGVSEATR